MIVALIVLYLTTLWLIFYKFKWVQPNLKAKITVGVVGCILIICLLFVCNYYQPYSTDLYIAQYTVPIVPRVTGRVIDVPVEPNKPLKEGDVLFRIDPEPFQLEVDRLEAQLQLTKNNVQQMDEALAGAVAGVAGARAELDVLTSTQKGASATRDAAKAALALGRNEVRVAVANVEKAKVGLEVARAQYARIEQLVRQEVESEDKLDTQRRLMENARAALDSANARDDEADDQVEMLEAQLAAAEAAYEQTMKSEAGLKAKLERAEATERQARLALAPKIDGVHASVRAVERQLAQAKWNLEQTVVYAPGDGYVTQLQLKPGAVAAVLPMSAVMVFVYEEKVLVATFFQNALRHVKIGDPVEISLEARPGDVFLGTVEAILPTSGQGQAAPTGTLRSLQRGQPADMAAIRIATDEHLGPNVPAGGGGAAAIYPGKFTGTKIIRRVIINMYSWMNYVFN